MCLYVEHMQLSAGTYLYKSEVWELPGAENYRRCEPPDRGAEINLGPLEK